MINFKKGTGHSLAQSDKAVAAKAGEGVVAGMLVNIDTGEVVKGVTSQGAANTLGFAINNQTDGDVINSGKIGVLLLDGNSVIETDQVELAINSTNYPVGTRLAGDTTTGKVKTWSSGDRIVGYVEGIRTLPVQTSNVTQNYTSVSGTTKSATVSVPVSTTVLGIKLAV
jgi:hypothetical protein